MKRIILSSLVIMTCFCAIGQDPAAQNIGMVPAIVDINGKAIVKLDISNEGFAYPCANAPVWKVIIPKTLIIDSSVMPIFNFGTDPTWSNFLTVTATAYDPNDGTAVFITSKAGVMPCAYIPFPANTAYEFSINVMGKTSGSATVSGDVTSTPAIGTNNSLNDITNNSSQVTNVTTIILSNASYAFAGNSVNCSNELKWNTTAVNRTSTFDIEKSVNGVGFNKVQTLSATYSVTGINSYSYADNNINAGNQYYRLKFTDISGNITYSNVIRLSNNCNLPKVSIYPNPVLVYQEATILLQNFAAKATGIIYDASGRQMGVIKLQNGTNRFNAVRYDAGTYTIKVNDEEGNASVLRLIIKR